MVQINNTKLVRSNFKCNTNILRENVYGVSVPGPGSVFQGTFDELHKWHQLTAVGPRNSCHTVICVRNASQKATND